MATPLHLKLAAEQLMQSLQAAGIGELPQPNPKAASLGLSQLASAPPSPSSTSPSSLHQPPVDQPPASQRPAAQHTAATSPPPLAEVSATPPATLAATSAAAASSANHSTAATLEVLAQEVAACTQCQDLATTRTQTVFGVGNPKARLCLLGEAPGAEEDRLGEPFVGQSGQLLDKILGACGLARSDVYILNTLKCRPPGNRNPTPTESQACRHFLNRQLELIDPEFICCLGAVAAQNLLDTTNSISKLRGQLHEHRGMRVLCTYHPAYLLRNPAAKGPCWEDMKLLMQEMGTPVG